MNKRKKVRFQLFLSIGSATLIILLSNVYLFSELSSLLKENNQLITDTKNQFSKANNLEKKLFNAIQVKMDYAVRGEKINSLQYQSVAGEIPPLLLVLESYSKATGNPSILHSFQKLYETSQETLDIQAFNQKIEERSHHNSITQLIQEQAAAKASLDQYIDALHSAREEKITRNNEKITLVEQIAVGLIIVALFIIIYTVMKVYQALQYVRRSSEELKRVNADYETVTSKVENNNWILRAQTLLNDKLSGIDDEGKISGAVLQLFNETLPVTASAIYIRKMKTDIFHLQQSSGVNSEYEVPNFNLGEGYLGKIAQDKKIVVLAGHQYISLKPFTSLIDQIATKVYLCPLVFENHCVGLVELAIENQEADEEKYEKFIERACRSIATSIKFGQNHLLVEHLLEETQHQTEELEAQQEELRITNEELIHKTHLLESSEEELRVQQEELTQTNFELNQKAVELEKRNADLNTAQHTVEQKIIEVQQASKYKSEFMANMSHELRTPLNSILILAKLLNDNKNNNLTPDQVKYAHVIHSAGSDLLALINELLDLAKIESGKVELSQDTIYLEDFTANMKELFKELAKDKEITFKTIINPDVPAQITSDEYRVQQVLKNFLSNAFKFTNKGGAVSLRVFTENDHIHFAVQDNGKGISQEKQDLIFEAFRQEDGSTSRKYGGTGLGLSISKEIAALLQGRIALQSELEQGSTFTLTLPLLEQKKTEENRIALKEQAPEEKPSASPAPLPKVAQSKNKKILIIEDDVNFATILKGFAEDYDFHVSMAHDGAMGIKLAEDNLPDAIILDVMLPISDGWKVLKELKENSNTKHIPIHMMSAASFSKKDFIEKGAIGFMQKPVTEQAIKKTFDDINLNLSKSVKKILLIEDQELQSEFIKNTFSEQQIHVIQAFTIEAGLNKLKEESNIDCIILDLQLPDGNGMEFIEKIKDSENTHDIPIIINTAAELSKEMHDKVLSYSKATILKSDKSNDRLIDEVNLFLNKLNDSSYKPVKNIKTMPLPTGENILKGKTVLIADDDMRNVFALSTTLQAYEMNIEIANNGIEALRIMEEKGDQIDIVLMDVMMPEMDGHEAIEHIRKNAKYKNLPILAVTAKAMKGDREKSLQIGANDYVSKPIDTDKLTSLMQIWLS